jgi:hypothetical protein
MAPRITNERKRMHVLKYVQRKESFQGNNLFGEWRYGRYVVTSYGDHFPLFIWEEGTWYENIEKITSDNQ